MGVYSIMRINKRYVLPFIIDHRRFNMKLFTLVLKNMRVRRRTNNGTGPMRLYTSRIKETQNRNRKLLSIEDEN